MKRHLKERIVKRLHHDYDYADSSWAPRALCGAPRERDQHDEGQRQGDLRPDEAAHFVGSNSSARKVIPSPRLSFKKIFLITSARESL